MGVEGDAAPPAVAGKVQGALPDAERRVDVQRCGRGGRADADVAVLTECRDVRACAEVLVVDAQSAAAVGVGLYVEVVGR